jgi:HK97 family phage major capsid protein
MLSLETLGAQFADYHNATKTSITELQAQLDRVETRVNRPSFGGGDIDRDAEDKRRAFMAYLRGGIDNVPHELRNSMTVGSDPSGGYVAPLDYEKQLERNLIQFSPIRQIARVGETSAGEVQLPKRTSAPTAYWVGEQTARTASESAYGLNNVPLGELACYTDVSMRALEDSAFDLGAELAVDLGEAFGQAEGAAFVLGNGVGGRPEGLLTAAGVAEVSSGAAATVTSDGLISLLYSLPSFFRSRATFIASSGTIAAIRKLKNGVGDYLFVGGLQAGQPDLLLGRPIVECTDMPELIAGSKSVMCGDFQRYRIFQKSGGTGGSVTIIRDPYSVQTSGLCRFHSRFRVGAVMQMPEAFRVLRTQV